MADSFHFDAAIVAQIVKDMEDATIALQKALEEFEGNAQPFMKVASGEAVATYHQVQARWDADTAAMHEAIGVGTLHLETASNRLVKTDNLAANNIHHIG